MSASSDRLTVLQVVDRDSAGGIPRIIGLVHAAGRARGWKVETVAWHGSPDGDWHHPQGSMLARMRQVRSIIRKVKPAIVHDHYGGSPAAAYLFPGLPPHRSVFHLHNELIVHEDSPDEDRLLRTQFFRNLLLPRFDAYLAVSRHSREQLAAVCPGARNRISVLHNAASVLADEGISRAEARQKTGIGPEDEVLLGLGRLVFEKGFDFHLQVTAALRRMGRPTRLVLAGDGDERYIERLKSEAVRLGIEPFVHFAGRTAHPAHFYRSADLFLFASHQEPFGLTLLEAMRCRLPVLAVLPEKGGGPHEFLFHGDNCRIVPREAGLAATEADRMLSGQFRGDLISGGAKTAEAFSEEAYGNALAAFYQSMTGGPTVRT